MCCAISPGNSGETVKVFWIFRESLVVINNHQISQCGVGYKQYIKMCEFTIDLNNYVTVKTSILLAALYYRNL